MRDDPLYTARSKFSRLIDRALTGAAPCMIWRGKGAIVIVSEADWRARPKSGPILVDLFIKTMDETESVDRIGGRSAVADKRTLGVEFADRMAMDPLDMGIVSLFDFRRLF